MRGLAKLHRLTRIRSLLAGFILGLVVSGVTVFPLQIELKLLVGVIHARSGDPGVGGWLVKVLDALNQTGDRFGFLFYGYDWLAFAHVVIAILFIGPIRDPVKNIWVIEWGMIACVLVLPLALICGPIRGIPLPWQMIDCSFGVVGIVPLYFCRKWILEISAKDGVV
jgi:hypothetical protein